MLSDLPPCAASRRPWGIERLNPVLRWALAMVLAISALVSSGWTLLVVLVVELAAYALAQGGLRAFWRDLRPLLWHIPFLLLATLIVTGGVDWLKTAETSTRIVLTGLPIFWLQRVATPGELLGLFERILPMRLRLMMLFAIQLLPHLFRDLSDIRMVQRLSGALPVRLADWRPRHLKKAIFLIAVPAAVRAVRLADEVSSAIEGRGLDEL